MIQRAAIGPTEQVGFIFGLKGPQFFGPKSGPVRNSKTQKALGRRNRKMGKECKQPAHTDKACLVGSGPAFNGPNPNAQRQVQRGSRRQTRGLREVSLGPLDDSSYSAGEKQCGGRSGGEGTSHLDALVDPAWICAKGPLLDADEVRTGLKDSDRFESGGNVGLWEMSSASSFLISPYKGTTENGALYGQALDLVERGFRDSEVEAVEDFSSRTFGSRYETAPSFICSPSLCSVFGQPLLSGALLAWGSTMGMRRWG